MQINCIICSKKQKSIRACSFAIFSTAASTEILEEIKQNKIASARASNVCMLLLIIEKALSMVAATTTNRTQLTSTLINIIDRQTAQHRIEILSFAFIFPLALSKNEHKQIHCIKIIMPGRFYSSQEHSGICSFRLQFFFS